MFSNCKSGFKLYAYKTNSGAWEYNGGDDTLPLYDISYSYVEYDVTKAGSYVYDEGIAGKTASQYQTSKTLSKTAVKFPNGDSTAAIRKTTAGNYAAIKSNYYDYRLDSAEQDSTDGWKLNVSFTPVVREYTLNVNGRDVPGTYHYQSKIVVEPEDVGLEAGKTYLWKDGGETVAMGKKFVTYITKNTTITATENISDINPAPGSTVTSSGYELKYNESGVQKITRDFYVQDFYHYTGMGTGNTFIGGGTLFRSVTGNPAGESEETLLAAIGRKVTPGTTTSVNAEKDATSGWTLHYKDTSNSGIFVYSNALRAYHYIQAITFTNNSENSSKKIGVYSFYIYRDSENNYHTVVSPNYAEDNMYEAR